jgi:hypothetical protein
MDFLITSVLASAKSTAVPLVRAAAGGKKALSSTYVFLIMVRYNTSKFRAKLAVIVYIAKNPTK